MTPINHTFGMCTKQCFITNQVVGNKEEIGPGTLLKIILVNHSAISDRCVIKLFDCDKKCFGKELFQCDKVNIKQFEDNVWPFVSQLKKGVKIRINVAIPDESVPVNFCIKYIGSVPSLGAGQFFALDIIDTPDLTQDNKFHIRMKYFNPDFSAICIRADRVIENLIIDQPKIQQTNFSAQYQPPTKIDSFSSYVPYKQQTPSDFGLNNRIPISQNNSNSEPSLIDLDDLIPNKQIVKSLETKPVQYYTNQLLTNDQHNRNDPRLHTFMNNNASINYQQIINQDLQLQHMQSNENQLIGSSMVNMNVIQPSNNFNRDVLANYVNIKDFRTSSIEPKVPEAIRLKIIKQSNENPPIQAHYKKFELPAVDNDGISSNYPLSQKANHHDFCNDRISPPTRQIYERQEHSSNGMNEYDSINNEHNAYAMKMNNQYDNVPSNNFGLVRNPGGSNDASNRYKNEILSNNVSDSIHHTTNERQFKAMQSSRNELLNKVPQSQHQTNDMRAPPRTTNNPKMAKQHRYRNKNESNHNINGSLCGICCKITDNSIQLNCQHTFCPQCLGRSISSVKEAHCPFVKDNYVCRYELQIDDIQHVLQSIENNMNNFNKITTTSSLRRPESNNADLRSNDKKQDNYYACNDSNANEVLFHCKKHECDGAWLVDTTEDKNMYACPLCNTYNCFKCKAIHSNMTCKEYKQRNSAGQNNYASFENRIIARKNSFDRHIPAKPKWECEFCEYKQNSMDSAICSTCSRTNDNIRDIKLNSLPDNNLDQESKWKCEFCDYKYNLMDNAICSSCSRTNDLIRAVINQPKHPISINRKWLCMFCNFRNDSIDTKICARCARTNDQMRRANNQVDHHIPNETKWECEFCGYKKNLMNTMLCVMCSRTNDKRRMANDVINEQIPIKNNWECQYCGYKKNNMDDLLCVMCSQTIPNNRKWKCEFCDYNENLPDTTVCVICSRSNNKTIGNNTTTWKCEYCKYEENLNDNSVCMICSRTNGNAVKRENKITAFEYYRLLELEENDNFIPNFNDFECSICTENIKRDDGVQLRGCLHQFCLVCIRKYIEGVDQAEIKCPLIECTNVLEHREIKSLVLPEVYARYLELSLRVGKTQIKNGYQCCVVNCQGWWVFTEGIQEYYCPICQTVNCISCKASHPGIDCKKYQEDIFYSKDQNGIETKKKLEQMLRTGEAEHCPKCNVVVVKNGGCASMYCSMCRTGFAWGRNPNRNLKII